MEDDWNELLTLLTPAIKKQDTVMRQAISPRDRLTVTLRYLATGNTFQDLSYSTRIAANTISKVIDETLRAIVEVLDSKVWNFPSSPEEWQVIAHKSDTLWNFPHCIGALDGKHINFRPPRSDGSIYRNYKGKDSIVLLGLVDAEYRFLFVDVGRNGRMHDSAVLRERPLWTKINDGTLNLPAPCEIPGFCYKSPYVIVGNDAFALKPNLLKPFPDRNLTLDKRIFNYRLSRARRTVKNAFGILANRWRVLLSTISLSVQKILEFLDIRRGLLGNFEKFRRVLVVGDVKTARDHASEPSEAPLSSSAPSRAAILAEMSREISNARLFVIPARLERRRDT
ncbi:uncharacterized protein LOC124178244 [Neodiprion fabricii]|uniref:uncharacterized protein LOC124178244 n=1 Tax=Neodiprion fabricii TaxID=2872261 RepID=UPI001ED91DD9|nr:uncharacterized protein LOC124178244 [Neodiprion fabricii]